MDSPRANDLVEAARRGDVAAANELIEQQELTLQETADAQGIATSTVKYRLRQALAELQKKVNPERRTMVSITRATE